MFSIKIHLWYIVFKPNCCGCNILWDIEAINCDSLWHGIYTQACCPANSRLIHSPSLVALGLSVGYEKWPLIGWHHWSLYSLELPQSHWIVGSCDWWEFLPFFRCHWQSPCTALMAGKCLPLGLCKETVKEYTVSISKLYTVTIQACIGIPQLSDHPQQVQTMYGTFMTLICYWELDFQVKYHIRRGSWVCPHISLTFSHVASFNYLLRRKYQFNIKSEVSLNRKYQPFPLVSYFSVVVCLKWLYPHVLPSSSVIYVMLYISQEIGGFVSIITVQYMMCANTPIH